MNNDEIPRNIEFVLSQQSQFASDLQKLAGAQVQAEVRMTRLEGAIVTVLRGALHQRAKKRRPPNY